MKFDNTFSVASPIDEVWRTLLDVERVAPCVPGAEVIERTGDEAYKVSIRVKLGPVAMTYRGDVEIVEAAEEEHRAVMRTRARESRGQGTADATVEMRLAEAEGATTAAIHTDVALSGRAAAMGQGIIADVSARLIDTFAENLAAMLAAPGEAAAAATSGAASEGAATTAQAATTAGEAAAAATPAAPRVPAAPALGDGLPLLGIVWSALAKRLVNPSVVVGALAAAAGLGYLAGRRGR